MPGLLARFIFSIKSLYHSMMHSNNLKSGDTSEEDAGGDQVPEKSRPINSPSAVSRFIYGSDKFRKSDNMPKPGAFLPEEYENRWETSVCHLEACADDRVWHLGRTRRADKTLHARIDFDVQVVVDQALACIAAPEDGFDEHAVIIEWPTEKEHQKVIAVEIAAAVGPCKLPPPVAGPDPTIH